MSNYEYCLPFIEPDNINSILELGARDCLDSIWLSKTLNKPVIAFECNPESISVCKTNLSNKTLPIKLVDQAVYTYNGKVAFFPFDVNKHNNIGASSLFLHKESNIQYKIEVPCTRLDTFFENNRLDTPELLCMDIQGAEVLALESLGEKLKDIKYIATEVSYNTYYNNKSTFVDMYNILEKNGFSLVKYPFNYSYLYDMLSQKPIDVYEFDVVFERD